jgi:hypothetical protein
MRLLIKDANLALEAIANCAHRPELRQHAIISAEQLEQLARQIREKLVETPTTEAGK